MSEGIDHAFLDAAQEASKTGMDTYYQFCRNNHKILTIRYKQYHENLKRDAASYDKETALLKEKKHV